MRNNSAAEDKNSPQVLFDQEQWCAVFRKAAMFTPLWKHLSLRLHTMYPS